MKRRTLFAAGGLAALAMSCRARRESTPTGTPSAAPPGSMAAVRGAHAPLSRIGGAVLRGERYFAELLVFSAGRVEAALSDPEGHALNEPADVSVELATRGARVTVPLRYSPRRERFQGALAASAEVLSDRAVLHIEHNERRDTIMVPRVTILSGPERGGHMFNVGELGVELSVEASGRLRAFVRGATGTPVVNPALVLEATLLTQALEKHRVSLTWDASSSTYQGVASAELRPGPMDLSSKSTSARIQQAALAPAAEHGGRVLLVGFHAAEVLLRPEEAALFVYDAFGKPYPKGHLEVVLSFETAPQPRLYRLAWDEKTSSYRAALRGADSAAATLSVWLTAGERTDFGAFALR